MNCCKYTSSKVFTCAKVFCHGNMAKLFLLWCILRAGEEMGGRDALWQQWPLTSSLIVEPFVFIVGLLYMSLWLVSVCVLSLRMCWGWTDRPTRFGRVDRPTRQFSVLGRHKPAETELKKLNNNSFTWAHIYESKLTYIEHKGQFIYSSLADVVMMTIMSAYKLILEVWDGP